MNECENLCRWAKHDGGANEAQAIKTVCVRVKRAVQKLFDCDGFMLKIDANERSITHRLGMYLADEFPCFDVDCEYNRNGADGDKKLNDAGSEIRPDIIIHRRGIQALNLLAFEAKKVKGKSNEPDREKLECFTKLDAKKYKLGVLLNLRVGHRPSVDGELFQERKLVEFDPRGLNLRET